MIKILREIMANKKKTASKKKVKPFNPDKLIELIDRLDSDAYYSGDGSNSTYHDLGKYCQKHDDLIINFLREAMKNITSILPYKEEEINYLRMSLSNAEDELAAIKKTRKMMGDY